jgi:hypothetical protein
VEPDGLVADTADVSDRGASSFAFASASVRPPSALGRGDVGSHDDPDLEDVLVFPP